MWYKGAVNPRTDGWGYQGVCWTCGKVGHKTSERTVRLQEVEGEKEPTKVAEGFVEEDAVEVDAMAAEMQLEPLTKMQLEPRTKMQMETPRQLEPPTPMQLEPPRKMQLEPPTAKTLETNRSEKRLACPRFSSSQDRALG